MGHECKYEPHIHARSRALYFFYHTPTYNHLRPDTSVLILDPKRLQDDIDACKNNPKLHSDLLMKQKKYNRQTARQEWRTYTAQTLTPTQDNSNASTKQSNEKSQSDPTSRVPPSSLHLCNTQSMLESMHHKQSIPTNSPTTKTKSSTSSTDTSKASQVFSTKPHARELEKRKEEEKKSSVFAAAPFTL